MGYVLSPSEGACCLGIW